MGGWVIEDPSITDDLIAEYKKTLKAGKALKGQVSMKGGQAPVVNKDVKDSMEFSFAPNDPNPAIIVCGVRCCCRAPPDPSKRLAVEQAGSRGAGA